MASSELARGSPPPENTASDLSAFKLPGAASLYEQLDKLVLVCLRDGRSFFGWLRSFDQYANLILDNTVERLISDNLYADVPIGIFVIRGENVMLLGQVDEAKELEACASMTQVSEKDIRKAIAEQQKQREQQNDSKPRRPQKPDWPIPEEF